jgi:prephenate dehydrogenase
MATLQAIAPVLAPEALLMDVGSTKCDVVAAARATLGERLPCFVPAHPIAGKEVAGIDHAEATLYDDRLTILTPLPSCGASQLSAARALWPALGSRVRELSPEAHDAAFAAVSHLPHLLAFAYVNGIATQTHGRDYLSLAGPGFRDFSRIAASDPAVWHDILRSNRTDVLTQLQAFRQGLEQLETAMRQDDGAQLTRLIATARDVRAGWRLGGVDTDQ